MADRAPARRRSSRCVTKQFGRRTDAPWPMSRLGSPTARPVMYFHGIPGSRLDFTMPHVDEAVRGSGARVIGIDRPGFGGSDFQANRTYADWPGDAARVADELELDRFAVLGYSAGGPYVVACARALADRITFAGIVSGVGPAETPRFRDGMGATDAIMTRLAKRAPALARLAVRRAARTARTAPDKFSRQLDKELSVPDLQLHADPDFRVSVREVFRESTRQGPAGVVQDYRISSARTLSRMSWPRSRFRCGTAMPMRSCRATTPTTWWIGFPRPSFTSRRPPATFTQQNAGRRSSAPAAAAPRS